MENSNSSKKRSAGLDVIRTVAVFFVVSVHFFLYNGYYKTPVNSAQMFFATAFRDIFYACVPLFMLLTGYLCSNKKLTRSYFGGIWRVIYTYTAVSIVTIIFQIFYLKMNTPAEEFIKSYFSFSAAPYAWYVAMYIGLFLLIPFLNILWHGLDSPRKKQLLLAIMIFLTALPSVLNGNANITPLIPGINFNLTISWWVGLYPLTYYFIGAYIREYQPKINPLISALIIIGTALLEAAAKYKQSEGGAIKTTVDNGYGNMFALLISVFIFLLLYDVDIKSAFWKSIFETISKLSLGIYLISYIFDQIVYYRYLNIRVPQIPDRFKYYFIIVPLVFFASLFASAIIDFVYRIIGKVKNRIKRSKMKNE